MTQADDEWVLVPSGGRRRWIATLLVVACLLCIAGALLTILILQGGDFAFGVLHAVPAAIRPAVVIAGGLFTLAISVAAMYAAVHSASSGPLLVLGPGPAESTRLSFRLPVDLLGVRSVVLWPGDRVDISVVRVCRARYVVSFDRIAISARGGKAANRTYRRLAEGEAESLRNELERRGFRAHLTITTEFESLWNGSKTIVEGYADRVAA